MIIQADVLSRQEVLTIRQGLLTAPFRDGRLTAGTAAEKVKDDERARGDDPSVTRMSAAQVAALPEIAARR